MANLNLLTSTPAGALYFFPEAQRLIYLETIFKLPVSLRKLAFSQRTGAYIRGLVRQAQLAEETATKVAFIVLKIVAGEFSLVALASILSSELTIAGDVAQAMAKDIEKELFGPVMVELNQYLQSKQGGGQPTPPSQPSTPESPNLLDLRGRGQPPQQ